VSDTNVVQRIFRARDAMVADGFEPFDALRVMVEQSLVSHAPLVTVAERVLRAHGASSPPPRR